VGLNQGWKYVMFLSAETMMCRYATGALVEPRVAVRSSSSRAGVASIQEFCRLLAREPRDPLEVL
jgi:hypothetical protein